MARLDRAIQPPHVHAANESCIAWMARFCGPWQWRELKCAYHPRPNCRKSRVV